MGYIPNSHPLFSRFTNPQPESTHVLADSQENHKYFVYGRINDDKIGAPNAGDCTPDVFHHEQMSHIIRYVSISDGNVSIKEIFIDFIHAHGKTGNGLASEIQRMELT
jgi:hypothetical protein